METEVGGIYLYKCKGGLNWCLCKVIAKYEKKVWIHNFYTGSMPCVFERTVEFKGAKEHIDALSSNTNSVN